uniref:Uncharacterized protein n=1 Tax=Romanomermis culicivorax TaxID=13658 RepID=A0A915IBJ8_ROMCU
MWLEVHNAAEAFIYCYNFMQSCCRQGCKSRSGSSKQPMKELLPFLLKINRIKQEEFEKAIEKLESMITG